nr:hypothetical protein [Herbiconiux sp. KACC 21604]
MNQSRHRLLSELIQIIDRYLNDGAGVIDVQSRLDSTMRLLDQTDRMLIDRLRDAEADLELAQYGMPESAQSGFIRDQLLKVRAQAGEALKKPS